MKGKFIKLSKPCTQNWENMKPNNDGSFCAHCAKTVIDFSSLSQYEIAKKMKEGRGSVCARLTQKQLNLPLPELDGHRQFELPFQNIAAGLIITSTFLTAQPIQAENNPVKVEVVQTSGPMAENKTDHQKTPDNSPASNSPVIFKGKVSYSEDGKPIEKAKISLITVGKIFVAYTLADGTFSMEVPADAIDNDNVIRVSYDDVKIEKQDNRFYGYETTDYILSKADMGSDYQIKAENQHFYLGGISSYSKNNWDPVVIDHGKEIKYKEFLKALDGQKSKCNLGNRDYLYFSRKEAVAIYGEKAKYGLYILTDTAKKPTP